MEKIALLTDSACDIEEDIIDKYDINVLPFRIIYSDREYVDKVEISPAEIYDNMKREIPKSSMPSMNDVEKIYEKLERENYTHVIAVVISSGLSGTYNSFKIVSEKHSKLITYIYDSKSTSIGEGIILKECGKLIDNGKSFKEIVSRIPEIKNKMHFFFVFGTLEYAKKGGRIGKISGTIGELLDIKPIVQFSDDEGVCFTYDKIRGRKRSLNRLIEIGSHLLSEKKCDAYIVHGNAEEDAKRVYEMLLKLPNIGKVYLVGQISAIVGVYSGPGTVGVCFNEC
jgi:DegV family protein with EDD domain